MKKVISLLLAVMMMFSIATIAFSAGSYQEAVANEGVKVYCTSATCNGGCTGEFGCTCCTDCPGYLDANGIPTHIGTFLDCAFGFYYDIDIYAYDDNGEIVTDGNGNFVLAHQGDYKTHYYWKAKCCEECTGRVGCKCNNTDYKNPCGCPCCLYEPDHTEEKIQEGLESGRDGYTKGIQGALISVRNVMYDLFDKLFKFLRIDVILGKKPSEV